MKKLCLIYNFAQHYRTSIFSLIDKEFECDFVFGDRYLDVKKMDYSLLKRVEEVKNLDFHGVKWQTGVLKYAFKRYDAYIVIGEPAIMSTWVLMAICKILRKPVYLWAHGWYGKETRLKAFIKKMFYKLSAGVLLYGNYAKNLMLQEGIPESKLHVIYNSLSYEAQLQQRENITPTPLYTTHFGNDNHNLIFVGRLSKVKKLDMILDAMLQASQQGIAYNCTFVGAGEEQAFLEEKVKEYGLSEQVWFYGPSYDEAELANLIYNADLCVSPGNVGLTAMHSLVYGCPVVTHDNFPYQMPEFEAIVPNKTGMFFNYQQIDSLCKAINDWFALNLDRESVRMMAYQEMAEHWNPQVQIEILKNIIYK